MRDIARQLRTDFGLVPRLVDEYVVHTPRAEAIKASRQVSVVSHYLSLMATGEVDMRKCASYGVAITCIDEVTDELGGDLYPAPIAQAFAGTPPFEPLRILHSMRDKYEDDRFEYAVRQIGKAQDMSMAQQDDLNQVPVEHITKSKGGWSARANLALFKDDITEEEWGLLWRFGFLMQMLDDHLDQPKDQRNGITTLYSFPFWDANSLATMIDACEEMCRDVWGESPALRRFFTICRLHRRLGQVENGTPLKASWLVPGYL